MKDIKELITKAKKEEKKNPEFLYQLGLRFKNGDNCEQSDKKAAKYFEKAADLGHIQGQIETAIRWWKHWNSYYYANFYLQKAIAQGSEDAKKVLEEMQETMESKDNPIFLYKQGIKFLNGEDCPVNYDKAIEYFYKAGKKNVDNAKLEYGKYYSKRFYVNQAEIWLNELANNGNEEAKIILDDLLKLKDSKNILSPTMTGALYETPKFKDSDYVTFCKNHTLICCPACKGKIKLINQFCTGALTEQYIEIHDKDTIFEKRYGSYSQPTYAGQTITEIYKCESCNFSFDKTTHTKLEIRDAEPNMKEILGSFIGNDSYRTDWFQIVKITYSTDDTNARKDVLKILKKSEGKYEGKYF